MSAKARRAIGLNSARQTTLISCPEDEQFRVIRGEDSYFSECMCSREGRYSPHTQNARCGSARRAACERT